MLPVVGSVRSAVFNYSEGNVGWGTFYAGMAVFEALTGLTIVKCLGKGVMRAFGKDAVETGLKKTFLSAELGEGVRFGKMIRDPSRYTSLAAKADIKTTNRVLYQLFTSPKYNGSIVRLRAFEYVKDGFRILGTYDPKKNVITLYSGSNMETLTHELYHFLQIHERGLVRKISQSILDKLRDTLETDVVVKMIELGYIH